jgi:hypothetical protein
MIRAEDYMCQRGKEEFCNETSKQASEQTNKRDRDERERHTHTHMREGNKD